MHNSKKDMVTKGHRKGGYTSFIAFLFFFFFASPALSPAFGGRTIYLHWLIVILDWGYLRNVFNRVIDKKNQKNVLAIMIFLLFCIVNHRLFIAFKIVSIIWCIVYLFYVKEKGLFKYLYIGVNINIVIAIMQFIFYYTNRNWAYIIGPTNISKFVWGNFATQTNTNMYAIFGNKLVRVCGWSREAGFFASLLIICFFCYLYDTKIRKRKAQYILYAIGFIISFSKASLTIIPLFCVIHFSKYINRIPARFASIVYIAITSMAAGVLNRIGYLVVEHESIAHRFIGYHVVWKVRGKSAVLGFGTLKEIGDGIISDYSILGHLISTGYDELCGWAGIVEYLGFLGLGIWILMLVLFRISASGILFLMLATFTVDPFTATSFVVLAYWIVLNIKGLNIKR
ncbi:hypothetical protein [uncultured Acetatifactor sp.]|jgi:hypothetical protein|uniref:hypothetical protein n=1 Tax=uncultured Acetatifactor sp. TaxID=1671927 RepID=UPI00262A1F8D|nr:hypothetical protein [uncultured Acetatifactor sp.]